jgi:hypothetical protein
VTSPRFGKIAAIAVLTSSAVVLATMPNTTRRVQANDFRDAGEEQLVHIGFQIAPVPLNLEGKDQDLVGLGSFIVNAVADCNGCHTAGGPPNLNYAAGGNPYFNQKAKVDPTVYLSGGMDFGPVGTPTGPAMYAGPDIIARNLTPDKTGRAEGGNTLEQFKQIMRSGTDFDHIHPTCTAAQLAQIAAGTTPFPVCIPTSPGNTPDGDLLQVMPWPSFASMTDHQLDAIYQYLSAIPCIDNTTSTPPAGAPNELLNDCGDSQASTQNRALSFGLDSGHKATRR